MPDVFDQIIAEDKQRNRDIFDELARERTPAPKATSGTTMRAQRPSDVAKSVPIESKRHLSYDPTDPLGYAKALGAQEGGVQGFVRENAAASLEPGNILLDVLTGRGFSTGKKVIETVGRARHLKAGKGATGARAAGEAAGKKAERAAMTAGGGLGAGVFGSQAAGKLQQGDLGGAVAAGVMGGLSLLLGGAGARNLLKKGPKGAIKAGQVPESGVGERVGTGPVRPQAGPGGGNRPIGSEKVGKPITVTRNPEAAAAPEAKVTTKAGQVGPGKTTTTQQAAPLKPEANVGPVGPTKKISPEMQKVADDVAAAKSKHATDKETPEYWNSISAKLDDQLSNAINRGWKRKAEEIKKQIAYADSEYARTSKAQGQAAQAVRPVQQVTPEGIKPVEEATGLANQVQAREAEAKILSEVEPTKGKSPEEWQRIGRTIHDEAASPDADPEGLSMRIARGEVELTGERVGVLLEGKRQLVNDVNLKRQALDAKPGDKAAVQAYEEARTKLDDYVTNVQAGKGRWSDVGRALQAGTELDTGNFAEVLQEARRTGSRTSEAKIKELVTQVTDRDARIAQMETEKATAQADRAMQRLSREKRTSEKLGDIQARRADAINRLKKTSGQLQAGVDPAQAKAFYDWAKTYVEEGVVKLDDIAAKAVEDLGWKREDVVAHLASRMSERKTLSDLNKQIRELRGEAGTEAKIANLKRQIETGDFEKPDLNKKAVESRLQNLRVERDFYAAKVRQAVKAPESRVAVAARAGASVIRGITLGSDVGVMMRQGLFTPLGVKGKATVRATKAAFSENALRKMEMDALTEKTADGRLVAAVEKKAGLSLSDHLTAPEENALGRILSRVPVVGPVLDRYQHAWINEARRMMMRPAIHAGHTPEELVTRAKFINAVTGRGNVKSVPASLELLLTGPRYEASRWQTLGHIAKSPLTAVQALRGDKGAKANVKDLAQTAATVYMLFKGAELAGYKVDTDPESGDFLKMRRGDEVWDVSAGIAPRLRDVMRLSLRVGQKQEYGKSAGDVFKGMVTRPLGPQVKTPIEALSSAAQRNQKVPEDKITSYFSGFPLEPEDKGLAAFSPLIARTFWRTLTEEKSMASALGATGREFVGTSVQRYPKKEPKQVGGKTEITPAQMEGTPRVRGTTFK